MTVSNENLSGTVVAHKSCSAKDWRSVNSAEILLVMEYGSGRQGMDHHRIHHGCMPCIVSMMLFLSSVVSVGSPYLTWAAVYQCLDAAGKPVLTNRPAQLHNCHVLSEGTASALTPLEASTPSQVSPPPIRSDRPSPPPYVPFMPPDLPTDIQGASIGSLPAPNPEASSLPSPPPPCARGLNPLNPLSTPPCVRSDQSGAPPPVAAPAPSP
jgi:hypothetical protein